MRLMSFKAYSRDKSTYGLFNANGIVDIGQRLSYDFDSIADIYSANAVGLLSAFENFPADFQPYEICVMPFNGGCASYFFVEGDLSTCENETIVRRVCADRLRINCSNRSDLNNFRNCLDSFSVFSLRLAIFIGKPGRNIDCNDAMSHVLGYSGYFFADTIHTSNDNLSLYFHPWVVTADEVGDLEGQLLMTSSDGFPLRKDSNARGRCNVSSIVSEVSKYHDISVGDVIMTQFFSPKVISDFQHVPI